MTMERGRPSARRRFPQGSGNEQQHVFGRAHDDRNDDNRQRDGAGKPEKWPIARDHDLIDEQADDDRGRAEQNIVDEAHDERRASNRGRIRP